MTQKNLVRRLHQPTQAKRKIISEFKSGNIPFKASQTTMKKSDDMTKRQALKKILDKMTDKSVT